VPLSKSTSYTLLAENIENTHMASSGAMPSKETAQTTHFTDAEKGTTIDLGNPVAPPSRTSELDALHLAKYLERPVNIYNLTWLEGGFLSGVTTPWADFIGNTNIQDKMRSFGMWRMNLHIKVVISASPFYYGAGLVEYNPLQPYHTNPSVVVGGDHQIVTYSQRPSFWIYPQSSQGGEMVVPFFWYKDWALNDGDDAADLGTLSFHSPQVLRNANSVVGADVNLSVYCWATDVELSMPTTYSESSSVKTQVRKRAVSFALDKDEYGDGPLSGPASAVASAAGELSKLPYIGGLARATQIGAGAFSRVAKFFGFTNPPNVANIQPYKDMPYGGFTSSDISPSTHPLTLDPKSELTIDPTTVGLPPDDELNIEHFCSRKSYMSTVDWDTSDAVGALLFSTTLSPETCVRNDAGNLVWSTPVAHTAQAFKYWRCGFKVSFDVICSQYHRGRLLIMYDASNDSTVTGPGISNVTRIPSYVVDISEETHIELEFPYIQDQSYHLTTDYDGTTEWGSLVNGRGNGRIFVYVQNVLTSPVASAPVGVLMSVSAYDVRFMGPKVPSPNETFVSQSSSVTTTPDDLSNPIVDVSDTPDEIDLVYGGENVLSLRKLLKRHCHVWSEMYEHSNGLYSTVTLQSMYPFGPTYIDNVNNIFTSGAATQVNYASNSFVAWFSPCFAGRRGSMYWAVSGLPPEDQAGTSVAMVRIYRDTALAPADIQSIDTSSTPAAIAHAGVTRQSFRMGNGAYLTNTMTQSGVTALVPYIDRYKFVGTHPRTYSRLYNSYQTWAFSTNHGLKKTTTAGTDTDVRDYYCAAGPDFSLHFFVGIPTIRIGSPPAP